jgi:anti-sigma regulatory factor (Ser/Thr protein kinase)
MTDSVEVVSTTRRSVTTDGDTVLVRTTAEEVGADVGFDDAVRSELGLVATELATNVLEHADGGEVSVSEVADGDRRGVRIESLDVGPGIDDVGEAFADGASTAGSLGRGLGAVNRLMDQVTVAAPGEPDYGTHVVADRWVRPEYESTSECPLSFGAASRPMDAGMANGDSFILKRWNDTALVGVIDGLGHGVKAHEATMAAKQYVERHFDNSLESIFEGAERACRGTRGVVMALARFDWTEGTVTFGSVGNVNYKTDGDVDVRFVTRRGVVGGNGPDPVVTTADWNPEDRLVLFSDGVGSHWEWREHPRLLDDSATAIARGLLDAHGKDHDDATVVVVAEAAGDG